MISNPVVNGQECLETAQEWLNDQYIPYVAISHIVVSAIGTGHLWSRVTDKSKRYLIDLREEADLEVFEAIACDQYLNLDFKEKAFAEVAHPGASIGFQERLSVVDA